ncbi:MAG: hypothetical protein AB7O49_17750 [Sphingomonadales bacterium]
MIHDEMVLVVPVLIFTFMVMGWIMILFRGYLRKRDAIVVDWRDGHTPVHQDAQGHREAV